jgi:CheY-like chemotaxis protein
MRAQTVLIIEREAIIRRLMAAVLRRTGFRTRSITRIEAAAALDVDGIDAVVADAWQPVAAAAPQLLPRTVIVTASPEGAAPTVFAVLGRPFDVDELVQAVRSCARRRADEPPPVDLRTLRRFVEDVPRLRRVLTGEWPSPRELILRSEMRRTVQRLSDAFREVARQEPSRTRAAAFLAASMIAEELAQVTVPAARAAASRDH